MAGVGVRGALALLVWMMVVGCLASPPQANGAMGRGHLLSDFLQTCNSLNAHVHTLYLLHE